ncbi:hypothetical protein [Roseobacter fucihabitans]|uniref:hypothetical protein n=1 Tax=Roseobacter fucihabitans TaxID=1537242 RepID=UPI001CA367E8|nr:hypothetical protein [Roseobacter litoralis]
MSGPIYAERESYLRQLWMAGRFHPNPLHPPLDRVNIMTPSGEITLPVIVEPVPEAFAH